MAVSIKSQDMRERIIKEGVLRYRQSSLYLQRWKPRYVVFKITHSGRLQLIIYKDQPAVPINEIKEVPIDEFGGLVSNLSLDNERYAFAIITTHITESFSSESPQVMTEWTSLLQEYLGKELVLNVSIPSKQNILKNGRAQLRIRNTGFTITTCDNPPRCQGTWQIIHIRKYGGSDNFRFQTGSKCPTGEFLYTIQTDDNVRLKSLFYDLSQHRPIFTDDRVGRRMTLERSFNHQVGGHAKVASRFSLQQPLEQDRQRVYQNHEALTALNSRHNSADMTTNLSGWKHSGADGDTFNLYANQPLSDSVQKSGHSSARTSLSGEDLSDRQYQNIQLVPHHGRSSPTKRVQHSIMKALPEKYYSVAPPQALKKYRTSINSTPPSSPDDDGFVPPEMVLDENTAPLNEFDEYEENEAYEDASHIELSTKVVGDSLVVHKASLSPSTTTSSTIPPQTVESGYYQNLAFMQGIPHVADAADGALHKSSTDSQASKAEAPCNSEVSDVHNYTNVKFATWKSSHIHSAERSRKISAPSGPSTKRSEALDSIVEGGPSSTQVLSVPALRNSHSNYELNKAGNFESLQVAKESQEFFDYYNILVPHLPANSASNGQDIGLRNKFEDTKLNLNHKYRSSDPIMGMVGNCSEDLHPEYRGRCYPEIDKQVNNLEGAGMLCNPNSLSDLRVLSDCDTLAPVTVAQIRSVTPSNPVYDSLSPKIEAKSTSSSPEPCPCSTNHLNKVYQYNRKVQLLQHGHKYEYIQVDLPCSDNLESNDKRTSSVGNEHPSSWMPTGSGDKAGFVQRTLSSASSRRKKQLPLQDRPVEVDGHPVLNEDASTFSLEKSEPQTLPKDDFGSGCESPKSPRKPQPLPRKGMQLYQSNSELVSSIDTYIAKSEVTELGCSNIVDGNRAKSSSPSRLSHEVVTPKIKSIHVELAAEENHLSPTHQSLNSRSSEDLSPNKQIQPPAIPPRPTAGPKDSKDSSRVSSTLSVQRMSEPGIKLPLPQSEISFQPPVPPRPRVLCPAPDNNMQKYVAVSFNEVPANSSSEYHDVLVHPNATITPVVSKGQNDPNESKVEYTRVDFNMTYGLGKTIEQVEDRRRGFPDSR